MQKILDPLQKTADSSLIPTKSVNFIVHPQQVQTINKQSSHKTSWRNYDDFLNILLNYD